MQWYCVYYSRPVSEFGLLILSSEYIAWNWYPFGALGYFHARIWMTLWNLRRNKLLLGGWVSDFNCVRNAINEIVKLANENNHMLWKVTNWKCLTLTVGFVSFRSHEWVGGKNWLTSAIWRQGTHICPPPTRDEQTRHYSLPSSHCVMLTQCNKFYHDRHGGLLFECGKFFKESYNIDTCVSAAEIVISRLDSYAFY